MEKLAKFKSLIVLTVLFSALFASNAFAANIPPTNGTITPSSGSSLSGEEALFTTTYNDENGWQDFRYGILLVNDRLSYANGCLVMYIEDINRLYLMNDTATGWVSNSPANIPGSDNILENSYAKLNCANTQVSGSGDTLSVTWAITFKDDFAGTTYNTYLLARDNTWAHTSWEQKGTWRVNNSAPRPFLSTHQHELLEELLDTHLNYFLSDDAVASSGLPLGAFKEGHRGRYNYSNPTEWGYCILAWIIAAENGKISTEDAAARIENALDTIYALQNDPAQNYQGLFYPYYYVVTPHQGNDLAMPYHDANHNIPSIDNGFLYTSLHILEGWARVNVLPALGDFAATINSGMDFRIFLQPGGLFMAHLVNADTGVLGSSKWDVYSDEGGVMAWIAYLSDSVSLAEYEVLINSMMRPLKSWQGIAVTEAAWFNAMFAWGVRSLAGFPVAEWETNSRNLYSADSFAPAVKAHLAYGDSLGIYYPAFSDAMTQPGMTARYTPPNIANEAPQDVPEHIVPHALFVPLCIGPDLGEDTLDTLLDKIADLKLDQASYYHYGQDAHQPFGFEVTASPMKDTTNYAGVESRHVYETLSHSYIVMSLFQGLNINDGKPTFFNYASQIPGYRNKVTDVLEILYSDIPEALHVPQDCPTIQDAIDAAVSGDTILVAPGIYNENLILNKSGIVLMGTNRNSIIDGSGNDDAMIYCENINGDETQIRGFKFEASGSSKIAIQCAGTVSSLRIEDNRIEHVSGYEGAISIEDGASCTIVDNSIQSTANIATGIWAYNDTSVEILRNSFFMSKIRLSGTKTALIKDNYMSSSWGSSIDLTDNADANIINNEIHCYESWDSAAGIDIRNSTARICNNIFYGGYSHAGGNGGIMATNSNLALYNNVFYKQSRAGNGTAIYASDTNLIAKNNIIYRNSGGPEAVYFTGTGTQDFSYNNFWENTTVTDMTGITPGPENITVDPMFTDLAYYPYDYHLQPSSLCIDAGDPDPQYNDADGTRNDIGIYGGPDSH